METFLISDLDEPFDLGTCFYPIEPGEKDKEWMEQRMQSAREIATMFGVSSPRVNPSGAIFTKQLLGLEDFQWLRADLQSLFTSAPPVFVMSARTYESIKLAHAFPALPKRKLRKVYLRRIAARKQAYRQHRARVNVADLERVRAAGAS